MDEELAAPGSMSLCQNATKTQELIKRKRAASICPGTRKYIYQAQKTADWVYTKAKKKQSGEISWVF